MGGNSGSGAQGQGQAGDQQLIQEAMSAWQFAFPLMQKLAPELLGTVQGKFTPLTEAARAPVIGQTQQNIATGQNQQGGLSNPNALFQQIAMGGEQQAGIAGDNMLTSALQGLSSLIQGSMQFSGQGLAEGSGQLNQLGESQQSQYDQEQSQFWQGLLGFLGGGLGGASKGIAGAGGSGSGLNMGGVSDPGAAQVPLGGGLPESAGPFNAGIGGAAPAVSGYSWTGVPSSMSNTGASTPASSTASSSNSNPNMGTEGLPPWLTGSPY